MISQLYLTYTEYSWDVPHNWKVILPCCHCINKKLDQPIARRKKKVLSYILTDNPPEVQKKKQNIFFTPSSHVSAAQTTLMGLRKPAFLGVFYSLSFSLLSIVYFIYKQIYMLYMWAMKLNSEIDLPLNQYPIQEVKHYNCRCIEY